MASSAKNLIRKSWPKVREIVIKGSIFYQVDPRRQINGKTVGGKREAFQGKKEALGRASAIAAEALEEGHSATKMEPELRLMAIKGKIALEEFGKTIDDAVSHYLTFLRTEKAKDESQTIAAMADLWLEEKKNKTRRNNLRPATLNDIAETNKILKRNFGHLKILEASKNQFATLPIGKRTKRAASLVFFGGGFFELQSHRFASGYIQHQSRNPSPLSGILKWMKVISVPGEFVANAEEERPAKSLFWACINDKEWCF